MARIVEYTWDPKTDRWRKNGKWCKPPTKRELGKNKVGQLVDSRGRRVPKRAPLTVEVRKPAKKAKKKAAKKAVKKAPVKAVKKKAAKKKPAKKPTRKKKRAPPRESVDEGEYDEYVRVEPLTLIETLTEAEENELLVELQRRFASRKELRAFVSDVKPIADRVLFVPDGEAVSNRSLASSRKNDTFPDRAYEAFGMAMFRKMEAAGYSADDVLIYRYGLEFMTLGGGRNLSDVQAVIRDLAQEFPHVTFSFAEDRVHAFLGREGLPVLRATATARMQQERATFNEIWERLRELWDGDISWFAVAENDEIEGKSG